MIQVTVDANILHALFKPEYLIHRDVVKLWEWEQRGLLEIMAPSSIAGDIPEEPLRSLVSTIPALPQPGPRPFGRVKGETRDQKLFKNLRNLIFPGAVVGNSKEPNRQRDIQHLISHYRNRRDIFVTDDKALLGRTGPLKTLYEITIMHPQQLISRLDA